MLLVGTKACCQHCARTIDKMTIISLNHRRSFTTLLICCKYKTNNNAYYLFNCFMLYKKNCKMVINRYRMPQLAHMHNRRVLALFCIVSASVSVRPLAPVKQRSTSSLCAAITALHFQLYIHTCMHIAVCSMFLLLSHFCVSRTLSAPFKVSAFTSRIYTQ